MKYICLTLLFLSGVIKANAQWYRIDTVNQQYYSIAFVNDTEGYLGGYGYYKKTTDGAATWRFDTFTPNTPAMITQFDFLNNGTTIAGGLYACYSSSNNGNTWTHGNAQHPCCFLPNTLMGFSAAYMPFGNRAPTFKTYNGDDGWFMQGWTNPNPNGNNTGVSGIAFSDSVHGCIITSEASIYITHNSGVTWIRQEPYNASIAFSGVYMKDSMDIFIVGNDASLSGGSNVIMHTTDGGLSWTTVFSTALQLGKITFANNNSGFVSGTFLIESIDGGNTWNADTTLYGVTDFAFPTANFGYLLTWDQVYGHGSINQIRIYNGTTDLPPAITFNIYPNPCEGQLFIKAENQQPQSVAIYNADGRIVYAMPFKPEIDINNLSSGVYFVEIKSKEGIARKRFVKM